MTIDPRTQAIISRFLLGLVVVEIPVATAILASPTPDYRLLAIGLLGGLATALEKFLSPQLASVVLPNAVVMPDTKPNPGPTMASSIMPPH